MIFSKEICPICNGPLEDTNPHEGDIYTFCKTTFYCCKQRVLMRDHTNTHNHLHTHYCYTSFEDGTYYNVHLIYPPYSIYYSPSNHKMEVNLIRKHNSEVTLFSIPPLNVDYSDVEKVVNKLKILNTFS